MGGRAIPWRDRFPFLLPSRAPRHARRSHGSVALRVGESILSRELVYFPLISNVSGKWRHISRRSKTLTIQGQLTFCKLRRAHFRSMLIATFGGFREVPLKISLESTVKKRREDGQACRDRKDTCASEKDFAAHRIRQHGENQSSGRPLLRRANRSFADSFRYRPGHDAARADPRIRHSEESGCAGKSRSRQAAR